MTLPTPGAPERDMKLTITAVRKLCEAVGAHQVVALAFDKRGSFACVSYGTTKAACNNVRTVCDEIADSIEAGTLGTPPRRRVAADSSVPATREAIAAVLRKEIELEGETESWLSLADTLLARFDIRERRA